MALIDKEIICAEIDKRYAEYRAKMKTDDFTYYEGMADALDLFEQFLDTIPEQPVEMDNEEKIRNFFDAIGDCGFSQYDILRLKSIWEDMGYSIPRQEQTVLPGIDKEGIPGRDFIPVEWVEACKNPDRSPDIALALHNRGAGYRAEVLRNLELIRRYEAARKTITEK